MTTPRIVVHSDVILGHLRGEQSPSALRDAMALFFCYTTVFQAIELFALLRSPREREAAESAMSAMKILGLNPKNAIQHGELFAHHRRLRPIHLLAAGLCRDSRLPLLTDRQKDFAGIHGLVIVPTSALRGGTSGIDILHELQR